jgi:hypothetical protein
LVVAKGFWGGSGTLKRERALKKSTLSGRWFGRCSDWHRGRVIVGPIVTG